MAKIEELRTALIAAATATAEHVQANAALRTETVELRAQLDAAIEALVGEREDNLWNAYAHGHVRDGLWDHQCMSEGEWLARECGFNVSDCRFYDEAVRAAIPKAARNVLTKLKEGKEHG